MKMKHLKNWLRKRKYRTGCTISSFVAKDVRRDVQVISTDQLESGFIIGRVRTINVLYSAKGLISEPEFGELEKIKIDEIWEWSVFGWTHEMIMEEIENPICIENYKVYSYHHLDFLNFMSLASDILDGIENKYEIMDQLKQKFAESGWEGDGVIRTMWLPPFVGAGVEDTWGTIIWVVKQSNNGTSFLASPVSLPFSRLLQQQ